jgi:hypothetical protein
LQRWAGEFIGAKSLPLKARPGERKPEENPAGNKPEKEDKTRSCWNAGKKTTPEENNKIKPADLPRIQTAAVSSIPSTRSTFNKSQQSLTINTILGVFQGLLHTLLHTLPPVSNTFDDVHYEISDIVCGAIPTRHSTGAGCSMLARSCSMAQHSADLSAPAYPAINNHLRSSVHFCAGSMVRKRDEC